ncbi:MAG: hypothetical protein N3J91_09215 [Verrucomicrobiae bacterium]|nr:hypothetical protein [Verrucomicrobiae bacterium]
MAWWNPIDWWTGIDREIERGREIDRQVDEFNRRQVESGKWTEEDYQRFSERNDWAGEHWREQVHDEFWSGAYDAWTRISEPVTETAKKTIALWVVLQWLLVLLALFLAYQWVGGKGGLKNLWK